MNKVLNVLVDNIKVIIAGIAALAVIVIAAVILSVAFGGETMRSLSVKDIRGTVVVIRGAKKFYASKKTVLQSGDVISTDENSSVRICLDAGKYIAIEPDSSVYVYYTQISDKGEISVNIANGAVLCQLNEPLTKKESFYVKTPNAAISVRGTVFRTEFSMNEKYMGYNDVMMTHVQNFDGSVMLQLYSFDGEKTDKPMLLTERTSAELISCSEFAQYGYINYDTDMYALDEITIKELIRVNGEHAIAYSLDELDAALRAIRRRESDRLSVTTISEAETEETDITETSLDISVTESSAAPAETTAPPPPPETVTTPASTLAERPPEETGETTYGTLATTMQTHIYTTFPGPKWWDMPNDNPYDDGDYDDESYDGLADQDYGNVPVTSVP